MQLPLPPSAAARGVTRRPRTVAVTALCLLAAASLNAAAPLPPTHFTAGPAEIVGYGDLDGNGHADAVIVDRSTGAIRAG